MSANINRRSLLPLFLLSHCRPSYLCAILPKMLLLSERQKLCGRGELKNWLLFLLSPLPLSGNFNKMSCWPPKVPFHKPFSSGEQSCFCLPLLLPPRGGFSLPPPLSPLFAVVFLISLSLERTEENWGNFSPQKRKGQGRGKSPPLISSSTLRSGRQSSGR